MDSALPADAQTHHPIDPVAAAPAAAPPRRRAPVVAGVLLTAAAVLFGGYWLKHRGLETTDDAQVEGHLVNVAARVSGSVAHVLVRDNQMVHAGDVLVELDPADYDAKVAVAQADVQSAQATVDSAQANLTLAERNIDASLQQARGGITQSMGSLSSSQAGIAQAQADVEAAESRVSLANMELTRVRNLIASGAISQAEVDSRQAQFDQANAAVAQARARLTSSRQGVLTSNGALEMARGRLAAAATGPQQVAAARAAVQLADARLAQARAALHVAELNRSYTRVYAPSDGLVSRRVVETGQNVGPDRNLLAIVPVNDVWVVANFKEDQVGRMAAGQHVDVHIDTFDRTFSGHVDSVAGASGSRFALLPPDNASGNFVKVVQRIPVLIRFDGTPGVEMRPGMSANVSVTVGH